MGDFTEVKSIPPDDPLFTKESTRNELSRCGWTWRLAHERGPSQTVSCEATGLTSKEDVLL